MKFSTSSFVLFAAAASANVVGRAACNADACARAVTGTAVKPALSSRTADCSSFQRTTVTPPVSVITEQAASVATENTVTTSTTYIGTSTRFVVYTPPAEAKKRDVDTDNPLHPGTPIVTNARRAVLERAAAPTVPAYAATCSGAARYASACACYGITSTVITLPTPSSTTTTTSTTTITETVSETQPASVVRVEVCKPEDDYGYVYFSAGVYGTYTATVPSVDRIGCCAACYNDPTRICSAYAYSSICQIVQVTRGDQSATDICPNGRNSIRSNEEGPGRVGVGPCGVGIAAPPP